MRSKWRPPSYLHKPHGRGGIPADEPETIMVGVVYTRVITVKSLGWIIKTHPCQICLTGFRSSNALHTHIRTSHMSPVTGMSHVSLFLFLFLFLFLLQLHHTSIPTSSQPNFDSSPKWSTH